MEVMKNIFERHNECEAVFVGYKTSFSDAKKVVCDGLRHFLKDKAKWVDGYDEICDWLTNNNGKGLLLYGENGLGKTLLCHNIIPIMFEELCAGVKFVKYSANDLKYIFKDGSMDYFSFSGSNVVFIDDVGTENIANFYGERIDAFSKAVDLATQKNILLVITTNLTPNEIKERYGLRTIDRLHQITRAICIKGKSLRGNNNEG